MVGKIVHGNKCQCTIRNYYRKTISEEHIVIVQEPNSVYVGHITSTGGDSKSIKQGIIAFFDKHNIDTEALMVIGCDGTNVNTGAVGELSVFWRNI